MKQDKPQMPLREQFQNILTRHIASQLSEGILVGDALDALESAVEAHDSAIAAQTRREFAEKVVIWIDIEIADRRAYRSRLTLEEVQAHIRAMAKEG